MNAIVYISDFNDMRFLVSSLASLRYFNKQIKVFLLSDRIPNDENKRQLNEFQTEVIVCKELFYTVFPNISKYTIKRWSNLVFYKLLIPLIPQLVKYDRILYVDTDTMFVKDFDFLMDVPMKCMYGMFYE
jgi:lipopolysaccharide biosynthesis glycosyltransferase